MNLKEQKWYALGYQAALSDVLLALNKDGEDAVREWIANNTTTER